MYLHALSGKFACFGLSENSLNDLVDVLIATSWEIDNKTVISGGKRKVYEILGLNYTTTGRKADSKVVVVADELDSYESLVREAGTASLFNFSSHNFEYRIHC